MHQLVLLTVVPYNHRAPQSPYFHTLHDYRNEHGNMIMCLFLPGQLQILNDLLELAPSAGSVFTDLPTDKNLGKSYFIQFILHILRYQI